MAGSGTVRVAPEKSGGTLTVDVVAGSGAKINGTIRCDAFTVPQVVAGD